LAEVVAFNSQVDAEVAVSMIDLFLEVVIAPSFTKEALDIMSQKPNVRLLELPEMILQEKGKPGYLDMKRVAGGMLLQEWDYSSEDVLSLKAVTQRQPTQDERGSTGLLMEVCKHVAVQRHRLCTQGPHARHRHRTDKQSPIG